MKRKIITFLIIVVSFLLQSTIFHKLTIASIYPNLMVIVTAAFGFMRGKKEGMAVGFICGLFQDLFWGDSLGFHMLIFSVLGYFNGAFERVFYDDDIKLPIGLIAASELIYGIITYACLCMFHGDFAFWTYLTKIILPELVYTVLITLVLYQVILKINKKLETEEQRSASRFV